MRPLQELHQVFTLYSKKFFNQPPLPFQTPSTPVGEKAQGVKTKEQEETPRRQSRTGGAKKFEGEKGSQVGN